MPINNEIPTHLNMRINSKLRYLTELAARARSVTVTEYIEQALWQSFDKVSLDLFPEIDEEPNALNLSRAERQERFRKRADAVTNPLSKVGDRLWSEHPFVRIQMLVAYGFDYLLAEDEKRIWDYVFTRSDVKSKHGNISTKLVCEKWTEIKAKVLDHTKHVTTKGGK